VSPRPAEARREASPHPGLDLSDPELARAAFRQSVVRGLSDTPRWLSCRYLYDAEGSALFERITEQPEYYLTRTEDALLAAHAGRLRDLAGDTTLVELGSGSSTKTRRLLAAWGARRRDTRYVAVDISKVMLAESCRRLRREFPALRVHGLAGTYEQALPHLRDYSPLVLLFLGSSLGNFNREETADFLERIRANLAPGDHLLLGLDLVKDTPRLEAAYDDAAGVTAQFTRNLFRRMNADLGTDVDVDSVEHVSYYNQQRERIDIFARFTKETIIALPEVGRTFRIAPGELVLTEVSRKFRVDTMAATAARHGFDTVASLADDGTPFAQMLLRRRADPPRGAVRLAAEREHHLARARTYELIAPLSEMQLTRQHSPLMSPVVWDLGHIANFEEQWVRRAHRARTPPDAAARRRDHLYDAVAHPRRTRSALPLLSRAESFEYLQAVHTETLRRVREGEYPERDPLLCGGFVHRMLAQHEAQANTILCVAGRVLPRRRIVLQPRAQRVALAGGEQHVVDPGGAVGRRDHHQVLGPGRRAAAGARAGDVDKRRAAGVHRADRHLVGVGLEQHLRRRHLGVAGRRRDQGGQRVAQERPQPRQVAGQRQPAELGPERVPVVACRRCAGSRACHRQREHQPPHHSTPTSASPTASTGGRSDTSSPSRSRGASCARR
jgi:L-histidine N-alpha-methyltransferase